MNRHLASRKGNYGTSPASVAMMSDAFRNFEQTVQLVGKKIDSFVSTADTMIRDQHYDSRRIKHEVDQIERKWAAFQTSIADYRHGLDDAMAFFQLMAQVLHSSGYVYNTLC